MLIEIMTNFITFQKTKKHTVNATVDNSSTVWFELQTYRLQKIINKNEH